MTERDPALVAQQMYEEADRRDQLAAASEDERDADVQREFARMLRRGAEQIVTLPEITDELQIFQALNTSRPSISEATGVPGTVPPRVALIAFFDALARGHESRAKPGFEHLIGAAGRARALAAWIAAAPADQPDLASIEAGLASTGANSWTPGRRGILLVFGKTQEGPPELSPNDCAEIVALIARAEEDPDSVQPLD